MTFQTSLLIFYSLPSFFCVYFLFLIGVLTFPMNCMTALRCISDIYPLVVTRSSVFGPKTPPQQEGNCTCYWKTSQLSRAILN